MSQDNNEAASASQSSTAVPRVGGNTCNEFTATLRRLVGSSHQNFDAILAHVARQRQEEPFGYFHELLNAEGKPTGVWLGCPNRKATEQAHIDGETGQEIIALYAEFPTPSAAVAEGVDTAEMVPVIIGGKFYYTAEMMTTYGAQQREAGRREGEAKLATMREEIAAEIDRATGAAVPPAKAEGMSDEQIDTWINGIGGGYWANGKLCIRRDELAVALRGIAILAQQAKGEKK